jgi:hypothetical protein
MSSTNNDNKEKKAFNKIILINPKRKPIDKIMNLEILLKFNKISKLQNISSRNYNNSYVSPIINFTTNPKPKIIYCPKKKEKNLKQKYLDSSNLSFSKTALINASKKVNNTTQNFQRNNSKIFNNNKCKNCRYIFMNKPLNLKCAKLNYNNKIMLKKKMLRQNSIHKMSNSNSCDNMLHKWNWKDKLNICITGKNGNKKTDLDSINTVKNNCSLYTKEKTDEDNKSEEKNKY